MCESRLKKSGIAKRAAFSVYRTGKINEKQALRSWFCSVVFFPFYLNKLFDGFSWLLDYPCESSTEFEKIILAGRKRATRKS